MFATAVQETWDVRGEKLLEHLQTSRISKGHSKGVCLFWSSECYGWIGRPVQLCSLAAWRSKVLNCWALIIKDCRQKLIPGWCGNSSLCITRERSLSASGWARFHTYLHIISSCVPARLGNNLNPWPVVHGKCHCYKNSQEFSFVCILKIKFFPKQKLSNLLEKFTCSPRSYLPASELWYLVINHYFCFITLATQNLCRAVA